MKKHIIMVAFLVFCNVMSQAQFNTSVSASSANEKELPGKIFLQFQQSVKPKSFVTSPGKEKKSLDNVGKLHDPAVMAKNISALAGSIKPVMFKSKFNMTDFKSRAIATIKMNEAMNMLKDLEGGLKPEALLDVWKLQRNGWLLDLNKL